ncbi:MAG: bifunctional phosphopantothenoylcysteine decarboxylase/phosphopantothenate--cysteine ligase CoaBC [Bacteroidales bacterium]|nr:bifunctional phosphopantothenoylcysteine decarboxylase/phosphopantothenate--cysteine ligase CoaBC [Bacteroidales bacterium]
MLRDKKILIGITGGIAAYKTAYLTRLFVKAGAQVKVIMTPGAKQFIAPLTLATLSKSPVLTEFYNTSNGDWNSHVDLGIWADAFVIAPATANTLAKMAHGIADNLLLTTYLSVRCPVFLAPAMDLDMYNHPITQQNLRTLKGLCESIIEPETGELASGLEGKGRMAEPDSIFNELVSYFARATALPNIKGKTILLSSGPTRENIDPVRYISNWSSGKMGNALALALALAGSHVKLVTGPVAHVPKHPNIQAFNITTAEEMAKVCQHEFSNCDGAILAAAVADYRPAQANPVKIKSATETLQINLIKNSDIASMLGKIKAEKFLVGFALETDNELENASKKLIDKNLDFIVLNSLSDEGSGFQTDTNKITILERGNKSKSFELKPKDQVANDILLYLDHYLENKKKYA